MDQQNAIRNRLACIARELRAIYELLEDAEPVVPDLTKERLEKRICVTCGDPIEPTEIHKRGCHERCYKRLLRRIKDGQVTDRELIEQGAWAPEQKGGRPPELDAIDTYIKKRDSQSARKKAAKKKPPKADQQ